MVTAEYQPILRHLVVVMVKLQPILRPSVEVTAKSQLNPRLLVVATKMRRKFHQNEKEITRSQNETEISPK